MIRFNSVTKNYGTKTALHNISINIPKGKTCGILGSNGSGKTTLMKLILGLVKPDSGSIEVDGEMLNGSYEYKSRIGYMPQLTHFPENMTPRELFDFTKKLRGVETTREHELTELLGFAKEMDFRLRTLSGGTRQKVSATLALMFNPEIIIVDEPTAGLDPRTSQRFKHFLVTEREKGKTVLITTHILSELEELADYIVYLEEGNKQFCGPIQELFASQRTHKLETAVAQLMEEVA